MSDQQSLGKKDDPPGYDPRDYARFPTRFESGENQLNRIRALTQKDYACGGENQNTEQRKQDGTRALLRREIFNRPDSDVDELERRLAQVQPDDDPYRRDRDELRDKLNTDRLAIEKLQKELATVKSERDEYREQRDLARRNFSDVNSSSLTVVEAYRELFDEYEESKLEMNVLRNRLRSAQSGLSAERCRMEEAEQQLKIHGGRAERKGRKGEGRH